MSGNVYRFQHWAFDQETGSASRKALLMALAGMASWETGRCEAKMETLMRYTELSDGCIRAQLRALEASGLLTRRPQHRKDGGRRGSEFLLLAPGVVEWPDGERVNTAGATASATVTPGRRHRPPPVGATGQELPLSKEQPLEELKATPKTRAREGDEVPEDFPDELRPHARTVFKVLKELAEGRPGARAVSAKALANVIMARTRKPLVRSAYDYAAWCEGHAASRRHKDVLAGYRNWLDRTDDFAGVEPLDGNERPMGVVVSMTDRPLSVRERRMEADEQQNARLREAVLRRRGLA